MSPSVSRTQLPPALTSGLASGGCGRSNGDGGWAWTGELVLDLRNGRDWSVADAELSVRRDTVIVRHAGRGLAVLDRDWFRAWLGQDTPDPYIVDDVVWTARPGIALMASGAATFSVTPESLSNLVAVI